MSTTPRPPVPRHLEGRASAYDLESRFTLDRYPLSLAPRSPTRINQERLPDPGQLADMELAYRGSVPDAEARAEAPTLFAPMLVLGVILALGVLLVSALVPLFFGLSILGVIAAGYLVLSAVAYRRLSLRAVVGAVVYPIVVFGSMHLLSLLITRRMLGTCVLAGLALALLYWLGSKPGAFYLDWIYTHAPLRPAERRNRQSPNLRPDFVLLGAIFLAAALLSWLSVIAAILLIAGICAWSCRKERFGLDLIPKALDLLAPYLTYGRITLYTPAVSAFPVHTAPGVWVPAQSLYSRKLCLGAIMAAVYVPLTLGLCYYLPPEIFAGPLFDTFERRLLTNETGNYVLTQIAPDFDVAKTTDVLYGSPSRATYDRSPTYRGGGATVRMPHAEVHDGAAFLRPLLHDHPHLLPFLAGIALTEGQFAFGWLVPLAILIGVPLNMYVLLAVYQRALVEAHTLRRTVEEAAPEDGRCEWEWYVDRLRGSLHEATEPLGRTVREAEHLFLGVEPFYRFPVLLDKAILDEHAYFVGETGSGKTTLGIMPILIQLIRGHIVPPPPTAASGSATAAAVPTNAAPAGPLPGRLAPVVISTASDDDGDPPPATRPAANPSPAKPNPQLVRRFFSLPPPMVVIDLKGDPALFHTIREEVEARRRSLGIADPKDPRCAFRFFTLEAGRATHIFNPFSDLRSSSCTVMQLCHLLLDSLSLSHGEGYGRSYYSRKNRHLLLEALKRTEPPPRSFEELYPVMRELAHSREHRECFELISTIHALTQYPQVATFQPLKRPADAIHMPSLIEHRQTAYFWLPSAIESISVREVSKLAIYCLLTAAIDRQRQRRDQDPSRRVYLVIDEFQRIAGENFKVILEQARGFGLSVMLANQTQGDLKTHDLDLRPAVRSNTRYKQYFALGDPGEIHDLKELSGEEIATLHTWTTAGGLWGNNFQPRVVPRQAFVGKTEAEFIKTRLTVNDILAASDHPLHSIIQVIRGSGYTQYAGQPIPLCSSWPMPEHTYRRRQREPWPTCEKYELETTKSELTPAEVDREAERRAAEERAKMEAVIRELANDVFKE